MRRTPAAYAALTLAAVAAVGMTASLPASARKRYADAEGKNCSYCHASASGGGARNYRGIFYQQNNLTFAGFDDAEEAKKAGVPIGPEPAPAPKSLGGGTAAAAPPPVVDAASVPDFGEVVIDGITFVRIPAGTYRRGTTEAQRDALKKARLWTEQDAVETPAREVRITKPFLLGKTEVSQKQWVAIMGQPQPNAGFAFPGDDLPAESVSWHQAQNFCRALSQRHRARYRLPTEAEWEYAARAGSSDVYPLGPDKKPMTPETLPEYAWFRANAANRTHPVGTRRPNAWGLHDMTGNVWEWCQDDYTTTFYQTGPVQDPVCRAPQATERVLRGGSWFLDPRGLRVALRGGNLPDVRSPYVGVRLVREL